LSQSIKRCGAAVSGETINQYFDNLTIFLEGIPLSHIINYDETNLTDVPGRHKIITMEIDILRELPIQLLYIESTTVRVRLMSHEIGYTRETPGILYV